MFKNYFKTAWRNLSKQKGLAFINIFGLSAGLACFGLFMLYAVNEFSFDRFHKNADSIYRVYLHVEARGDHPATDMTYQPMPLGPALKQDLPDVDKATRLAIGWGRFAKADEKVSFETIAFADPSFFSMFSFKMKSGDAATALRDPHSIVLSEATAKKLFGKKDPIGKTIQIKMYDDFDPFVVTAVAENPPANSTIQFEMLGNFEYLTSRKEEAKNVNNWHRFGYQTFIQLKPGSDLPHHKERLIAFRKKYQPEEEAEAIKNGWKGNGPLIFYA